LPNIVSGSAAGDSRDIVGQFAGEMVAQSARNSGIDFAPSLVVCMMAVEQLKIDTEIVRIVTSFVLGGAALAFGISFGFGTRDVVRNISAGFYGRKFLHGGNRLEISGQRGVLTEINATHAILQAEDHDSRMTVTLGECFANLLIGCAGG
jgi:hypothetical protein